MPRPCPLETRRSPCDLLAIPPGSVTVVSSQEIGSIRGTRRQIVTTGDAPLAPSELLQRRGFECTWHGRLVAGNEIPQLGPAREGFRIGEGGGGVGC